MYVCMYIYIYIYIYMKEAPATTVLTVVNDTAGRCRSPWRAAAGACAVGVGALVDQTPILTASLVLLMCC